MGCCHVGCSGRDGGCASSDCCREDFGGGFAVDFGFLLRCRFRLRWLCGVRLFGCCDGPGGYPCGCDGHSGHLCFLGDDGGGTTFHGIRVDARPTIGALYT